MRIALNLAIAPSARERYAAYWAIPATLLGLAGLVFLLVFSNRSFREYKNVEKSAAESQQQVNALTAQEMALRRRLEAPQTHQLVNNAQFINGLISGRRFSLTDLAADITRLMPLEVCLTGLAAVPDGQEMAVKFVITGKNEKAIEVFLSNLEDSPRFKDVAIINQGFEQQGAASELENIACTAHYLMGVRESSEE
jgi:hypothetical protein